MNKYDHLSYSSISRYQACPTQFNFYTSNKKPLPSDAAAAGRDRHAEIARHLTTGTIDQSAFGPRMKNFCKYVLKTPTAVEKDFELDFITNRIIGKIDAYAIHGNQAVIVDWKSWPGFQDELQLEIYSIAIRELHPEVETIHGFFFFTGPDYYEQHTYFVDDLQSASDEIARTMDTISSDNNFEPRPGQYCGRCDYVESCPEATKYEVPKVESLTEVITTAGKIFAVEALIDVTKDRIKSWLMEHGLNELPIDAENRYYLSTSTALRTGKIKSAKDKKSAEGVIELATKKAKRPEPVTEDNSNIVKLSSASPPRANKIKMSDIVSLMKEAGMLKPDATNDEASNAIREIIGTNFSMATDEEKHKLRTDIEAVLMKKAV